MRLNYTHKAKDDIESAFSVFYTIEDKEIVVHSVFDNRQDPVKKP